MAQIPLLRTAIVALVLSATLTGLTSFGATVPILEWDSNSEPVAGYNVYIGESSGDYSRVIDVGSQTSFPLTNLPAGITHFFAVTAYDADLLESTFSEEVAYTPLIDDVTSSVLPYTFSISNGTVTLRFTGRPLQHCWIAASSDLIRWEEIYSGTFTESATAEYAEGEMETKPIRFYRVIATPP